MTCSEYFLKKGTFTRKKYNKILIACIGAWFVSLIDSCADLLLAGAYLDETAVSAISLVQPITSVICFFAYMVSTGTAILFSRECGAFRQEKAYCIVGQGIICSMVIAVLLFAVLLLMRDPLMVFYGAGDEITALAKDYYMCEIFFAAIYPIYFLAYQLVVVDGDEVCGFMACLMGVSGNIVASILMVGPLGVMGLAYGTIVGTVVGFLCYCIHFLRKTNSVHAKRYFNLRDLGYTVTISSSTSMTLLYIAIIDIVMNKFVINFFGDEFLPAYAVVNFMLNLGAVFCSLYDAGSGFVSVAYGEKNPYGIRQTMHIAYRPLIILSVSVMVILLIIAPYTPDLYGITDSAVRKAAIFAAKVIALSCPTMAVYYLFSTYYSTVGHVWMGHLISILYMLVTPLALAIPLGMTFGFKGLSVGFMLTSIVAEIFTAVVICICYGRKAVPLILDETEEERLSFELYLSEEAVTTLCENVYEELRIRNVPSEVSNEVQLILEESYMSILELNPGKKLMTQCDLFLSPKHLRVITRDNGIIFNITDANAKVKNLRSYVLALLMERNTERSNTTTISFNRNSYLWELEKYMNF